MCFTRWIRHSPAVWHQNIRWRQKGGKYSSVFGPVLNDISELSFLFLMLSTSLHLFSFFFLDNIWKWHSKAHNSQNSLGWFGSAGKLHTGPGIRGWGGGGLGVLLPYKRLMGMCCWMGSHFHDRIDYHGVALSIELLELGCTFSDIWGETVLHIDS